MFILSAEILNGGLLLQPVSYAIVQLRFCVSRTQSIELREVERKSVGFGCQGFRVWRCTTCCSQYLVPNCFAVSLKVAASTREVTSICIQSAFRCAAVAFCSAEGEGAAIACKGCDGVPRNCLSVC